jgi:phage-related protein
MKNLKPIEWVGSSRADLREFPDEARRAIGVALFAAQIGGEDPAAKALQGFGGRSVLEIVDDFAGDAYRGVYTVRFAGAIYVLHCFQKKSKKGSRTPQVDIELIKSRLKVAEVHYRTQYLKGGKT